MEPMYHQYDFDAPDRHRLSPAIRTCRRFQGQRGSQSRHAGGPLIRSRAQNVCECRLAWLDRRQSRQSPERLGYGPVPRPTFTTTVQAMLVVLEDGGFKTGGLNFDAKVRRESTDLEDPVLSRISAVWDSFARGLLIAHEILEKCSLADSRRERYASFDNGQGQGICQRPVIPRGSPRTCRENRVSRASKAAGREWVENVINDFMFRVKP